MLHGSERNDIGEFVIDDDRHGAGIHIVQFFQPYFRAENPERRFRFLHDIAAEGADIFHA